MHQGIKASAVIGRNIRKHRVLAHLTQEQLSAKMQLLDCDVSRGTLAKLESGIRHISVQELQAIRQTLHMQYEDFFTE